MKGALYEVVWPLGKSIGVRLARRSPISDLQGKTICELSDWLFRTEEVFPIVEELLLKQYPDIRFVDYTAFGNTHGPKESEVIAALPDMLRQYGCDAVISGIGA